MAGRGEIKWKLRDADGHRYELRAQLRGGEWRFWIRLGRFDSWKPHPNPSKEDWFRLLDAVERRVTRRLIPEETLAKLRRLIRELFS